MSTQRCTRCYATCPYECFYNASSERSFATCIRCEKRRHAHTSSEDTFDEISIYDLGDYDAEEISKGEFLIDGITHFRCQFPIPNELLHLEPKAIVNYVFESFKTTMEDTSFATIV
jgi:hypothetical protein